MIIKGRLRHAPPILSDEKADGRFWLIVWGYASTEGVRQELRGLLPRVRWTAAEECMGDVARAGE